MDAILTQSLAGGGPLPERSGQPRKSDPWDSGMWAYHREDHLGDPSDWVFDPRIVVLAPASAEDAMHVPFLVDATALAEPVTRMVVTIDYSPIPKVLTFYPGRAAPLLGFGVKYEVGSVLRASCEHASGQWSCGGANVDALGGGCSAPAAAHARPDWQVGFGEMRGRLWPETCRARIWLRHPQDTGLADGIPAHHLTELTLQDPFGDVICRLDMHESVEENPALTFLLPSELAAGPVSVAARDNMGNVFRGRLEAGA